MRIALLANPSSGRGRGTLVASFIERGLREAGLAVDLVQIDRSHPMQTRNATRAALARAHAVAIIGGDGTMRHSLPELLRAQVPAYHVPLGTENLFSRATGSHFGIDYTSNVHQLAAWTQVRRPQRIDLLQLRPRAKSHLAADEHASLAAIMLSAGPDASIVHRLSRVRTGPITHFSYARPVVQEALAPYLPLLTITADGASFITRERGWLVIANMPTYARGFNPCTTATPRDGLLDIAFFPATSTLHMLAWLTRCATRQQFEVDSSMHGAATTRAAVALITTHNTPLTVQADGDPVQLPQGTMELEIAVRPGVLLLLQPPRSIL